MTNIKRQYIVTDNDRKIGVVLDIETFEKIEELLENCGLALSMDLRSRWKRSKRKNPSRSTRRKSAMRI